jgi:hypothetical protein
MRPMAIGANRRFLRARRNRSAMHALLIRNEHLSTNPAGAHHKLLLMTATAGGRNVGVVNLRGGITGGQNGMWTSMTVGTFRCVNVPSQSRFAVHALIVCRLLTAMARAAGGFRQSGGVREGLDVCVAIRAA